MKKTISSMIILLLLILPAISGASYLILLKNGGRLVTPMHWIEGEQIKFYYIGGIVGVEKDFISKIEKSDRDLDEIYEVKKPEKRSAGVERKPSMPNAPKIDKKEDTKKDPNVMQEFNKLEIKFESRKSMTIDELKDLKNDLTVLRDKIVSNHLEDDFREEVNKIADMRFFTNDLLIIKSRSR